MLIYSMSGRLFLKLKVKPDFETYFKFLDEYFALYNITIESLAKKRKPIQGHLFLL